MILLSNAVDSKIASATSTYPALILKVQQGSSTLFKNIQFYCPTTMSGSPTEACFATNNWLEAPVKPHNGAEDYDFKPGGVIIISYADGNLSSPQFVRWLNVSDDIIETNYGYILGNPIVPDAVLSIWDDQITLSDPILQKAVMLLPYIQTCARGSKNLTASQYIQRITNEDESIIPSKKENLVYRKCGKYGIELISKGNSVNVFHNIDAHGKISVLYGGNLDHLYKTKYAPNTTFLSICSYLLNKMGTEPYKIIEVFNKAASVVDDSLINSIDKDETTTLYLFQMLAGYDSFKTGGSILNNNIYQNYNKNSIKKIESNTTADYIGNENFYNNNNYKYNINQREKFCSYFWYVFDSGLDAKNTYNKEIDRIYAIIMHNNLYRLKQSWFLSSYSKILVCCAVIATSYPCIEYYIMHPEVVKDENINSFLINLKNINDIILGGLLPNGDSNYLITSQHIAKMFSTLFYQYALEIKNIDVTTTEIYKNIDLGVREIINNWDAIYNKLGETLTTKPGTYIPPESGEAPQFIWPMPGYSTITSPFGPRWGAFHNGIDISGSGAYGKQAVASAAGKVIISRSSSTAGNYVAIDHGNGYITRYLHGSKLLVNVGDVVYQGQPVILVGNTGNVSPRPTKDNPQGGTHLHFDIKYNNNYVDPQNYIKYGN